MPLRSALRSVARVALLSLACASCGDDSDHAEPELLVAAAEVSERFVSIAVDMDQLAGGTFWDPAGGPGQVDVPPYDFSRTRLRNLARALAPAYLRLGGSASDRTYYDLGDVPLAAAPEPYELMLARTQWDAAADFARQLGLQIVFTVNAGPGPRDAAGLWTDDNARELLDYSAARGYPLAALEFGNEPNLFALRAGLPGYTATELARDLAAFRTLRDEVVPGAALFAPGNVYTRTQGEDIVPGFVFGPRATETLPLVGAAVDGVNYHYYAAISTRCPSSVRVDIDSALDPDYLDGVDEAAAAVDDLRDAHAAAKPVWLSETGGQSCGGQVGVADRFANTFWFLNTLGRLARRGHQVVVRQTLSGSTYGLLDEVSLQPRPDYWAALMWRRLMGTRVLAVPPGAGAGLRLFAHCQRDGRAGAVSVLALNANRDRDVDLLFADLGLSAPADVYAATAPRLDAAEVFLNGAKLESAADGVPPAFTPARLRAAGLTVPAASWAFAVFSGARLSACR